MDALNAYLDAGGDPHLRELVDAAIDEAGQRSFEELVKLEEEFQAERKQLQQQYAESVAQTEEDHASELAARGIKLDAATLRLETLESEKAANALFIDQLKETFKFQKDFFAPVVGYELLSAIVQKEDNCKSELVNDKINERASRYRNQCLRTFSITNAELHCLKTRFQDPRNSVCHHAWIWVWLHGGTSWVKEICQDGPLFQAKGVDLKPLHLEQIDAFLERWSEPFYCCRCKGRVQLSICTTVLGVEGLRCPVCHFKGQPGVVVSKFSTN